jgi:hypothetical protein
VPQHFDHSLRRHLTNFFFRWEGVHNNIQVLGDINQHERISIQVNHILEWIMRALGGRVSHQVSQLQAYCTSVGVFHQFCILVLSCQRPWQVIRRCMMSVQGTNLDWNLLLPLFRCHLHPLITHPSWASDRCTTCVLLRRHTFQSILWYWWDNR